MAYLFVHHRKGNAISINGLVAGNVGLVAGNVAALLQRNICIEGAAFCSNDVAKTAS
jgi:hypothetical protein